MVYPNFAEAARVWIKASRSAQWASLVVVLSPSSPNARVIKGSKFSVAELLGSSSAAEPFLRKSGGHILMGAKQKLSYHVTFRLHSAGCSVAVLRLAPQDVDELGGIKTLHSDLVLQGFASIQRGRTTIVFISPAARARHGQGLGDADFVLMCPCLVFVVARALPWIAACTFGAVKRTRQ